MLDELICNLFGGGGGYLFPVPPFPLLYHPFDIIMPMKLLYFRIISVITVTSFRALSNEFALQLQLPCSSNRVQLQEIIPGWNFQSFSAITVRW